MNFPMVHMLPPAVLIAALVLPSGTAAAEILEIDLQRALTMAVENSHLVRSSTLEEEEARVNVRRARAERYIPETELLFESGLIPAARGTAVDSTDKLDSVDNLGPFFKVNLKVVQPLYTWGRLENLEKTAREGVGAAEVQKELTIDEVSLIAVRGYWTLLSSRRALVVAEELRENFYKLLEEVEERVDDESSEVDDSEMLRVKSSTYRIEKTFLDSKENLRLASLALSILLGADPGAEIVTGEVQSPAFGIDAEEFDRRLFAEGMANKQVLLLEAASRALAMKIEVARSDRYPLLFLAAGAGYARAPGRDDQTNPFVLDDFNYARVGAEVGLKWKPNVYKSNLEVEGMTREYEALLEKIEALRRKITVETSERYGEAAKLHSLLEAARTSRKASRSWLRLSADNWEMGIGEVKKLLDAYEAYYTMKGIEIAMELEYNLSLAEVANSLGDISYYVKWVKDGQTKL